MHPPIRYKIYDIHHNQYSLVDNEPVPTFVDLQGFIVNKKCEGSSDVETRAVLMHYIFMSPVSWKFLTRFDRFAR